LSADGDLDDLKVAHVVYLQIVVTVGSPGRSGTLRHAFGCGVM
jgi:hypothetical protein